MFVCLYVCFCFYLFVSLLDNYFVGLEEKDGEIEPYIYAADLIGAGLFADDFVVAGTASEALYGLCESLYKPEMV